MNIIILPGFSLKNKQWAEDTKKDLEPDFSSTVIYWSHWETGKAEADWIAREADKIAAGVAEPVNIIAKSIGTAVAMEVIRQKPRSADKIIFCGVPVVDFLQGDEKYYQPLVNVPAQRFLCFQNLEDNHGSYVQAEEFLHSLNPHLKIISKPRSDHEYPYSDDFKAFLKPESTSVF
jgi:predicted alpha/beta hydrolase family esterase